MLKMLPVEKKGNHTWTKEDWPVSKLNKRKFFDRKY